MKPFGTALCSVALLPLSIAAAGCLNNHHPSYGLRRSPSGVIDLEGGSVEISDSFSRDDSVSLAEGYRAVATVLANEEFPAFTRALSLTLATSATDDCEPVSPEQITKALKAYIDHGQPLRVNRRKNYVDLWRGTTAGTDVCGATHTYPAIAERWENPSRRAQLVNTIAHEMTHLLPTPSTYEEGQPIFRCDGQHRTFYITDARHDACDAGDKTCDDAYLASYSYGDLVQCFHETYCPAWEDHGLANFKICYDTTINMERQAGLQRAGLKPASKVAQCIGAQ